MPRQRAAARKNGGQIGFKEMHDAQRGEKNTDAENMPVMKECRHYRKIDDGLRQKEGQICPLHRHTPYRSISRWLIDATPRPLEQLL